MIPHSPQPSNFWNTVAFVTLTVQTAATILTTRYSRLPSSTLSNNEIQYAITSAVALAEFGKIWVGIILLGYEILITKTSHHHPFTTFSNQLFGDSKTFFKMAVPACAYAIQNNLLINALQHLDSATYQVTYQIKIFTAAIFSIILLRKSFSTKQWLSFVLLAIGAMLANYSLQETTKTRLDGKRDHFIGFVCVISATITSGFSGAFMELELKGAASLYVKNIQLGMFGFFVCFLTSWWTGDWQDIVMKYGFLHGFTTSTWSVVILNIFGGYLVAFVLKRASNVIKSFSSGLSVILVVLGSYIFLETQFTSLFYLGATLVLCGNALYQREGFLQRQTTQQLLPT